MDDSGRTPPGARGIGTLPVGELAGLWAVLVLGLVLRTVGIGWGLPPATPEVAASGFRGSYALGEGEILDCLAAIEPEPHVREVRFSLHRFGSLHLQLTLFGLGAAQKLNLFDSPWRDAYRQMEPGGFERIYILGRLVSGVVDLATVFIVFLLGREVGGASAGLWSAAVIAVAPGHVVLADQISVEPAAVAMLTLAALLGVRLANANGVKGSPWMGAAGGLAIAAKYSVAPMALAICGAALWPRRRNARGWILAGGGLLGGLMIGEIFLLLKFQSAARMSGWNSASEWAGPVMLGEHIVNLARLSIGFLAAAIGAWGLWKAVRAEAATGRVFVAALAGGLLALSLQGWPMMRNHLPLVPLFAVGAGYALSGLRPTVQWPLGLLALSFGLAGSLAQIHFMLSPHPANLALAVVRNSAAPGETISRVTEDIPPLDERVYPNGANPLTENLSTNPPDWVVMTDLPAAEIPAANRDLLKKRYETIAIFRAERIFAWATFGERGAPPDWKYTHPTITLYRLKR